MILLRYVCALLFFTTTTLVAQDNSSNQKKYDVKRCTPKVVKYPPVPKHVKIDPHEKPSNHSVLVWFEILESGQVANVKVKRSSGHSRLDRNVLDWVSGTKYNSRPGCGVIEDEAAISIHPELR